MGQDLAGRTAVVTGASRGIGLAVVRALADEGARVVAGARTVSPELRALTPLVLEVDLATPQGPGRLIERALAESGGVDILVNNVAGGRPEASGFLSLTDEDWQRTLDLTLLSAVRAIRAALPSLIERRGSVVNIGSVAARMPAPALVDYSAAKAALVNLGRALAEEFGGRGVRVNTVSPGMVRTPVFTEPGSTGTELARQNGLSRRQLLERLPTLSGMSTGEWVEPEEVAALVTFLASRRAEGISGADYVIDGGMLKSV